jgi:hypothetical protein
VLNTVCRIAREREEVKSEFPKKKRRPASGVETADMSLVTTQNAMHRRGWKVTAIGRVIRPMKMRPARPLPDMDDAKKLKGKFGGHEKNVKRRVPAPITRARRRMIDPTKWGSVYLKGMLFDANVASSSGKEEERRDAAIQESGNEMDEDEDEDGAPIGGEDEEVHTTNPDVEMEVGSDHDMPIETLSASKTAKKPQLKDLFVPTEDNG